MTKNKYKSFYKHKIIDPKEIMKNNEKVPDIIISRRHKKSNEYLIIKSLEKEELQ